MHKKNKGSALLLTTILLFVVLSMVVSLTYVTVMEQKMSSKTKSSIGAFFNADSGVEWALNKIATASGSTITDVFGALGSDGSTAPPSVTDYKVYLLDSEGKVINNSNPNVTPSSPISEVKAVRAVGTQGGETQRAIEAAVAATGSGTWVEWGNDTCSGGGTRIYPGTIVAGPQSGSGFSGTICLEGNLGDYAVSVTPAPQTFYHGGGYISGFNVIPCAVCRL